MVGPLPAAGAIGKVLQQPVAKAVEVADETESTVRACASEGQRDQSHDEAYDVV